MLYRDLMGPIRRRGHTLSRVRRGGGCPSQRSGERDGPVDADDSPARGRRRSSRRPGEAAAGCRRGHGRAGLAARPDAATAAERTRALADSTAARADALAARSAAAATDLSEKSERAGATAARLYPARSAAPLVAQLIDRRRSRFAAHALVSHPGPCGDGDRAHRRAGAQRRRCRRVAQRSSRPGAYRGGATRRRGPRHRRRGNSSRRMPSRTASPRRRRASTISTRPARLAPGVDGRGRESRACAREAQQTPRHPAERTGGGAVATGGGSSSSSGSSGSRVAHPASGGNRARRVGSGEGSSSSGGAAPAGARHLAEAPAAQARGADRAAGRHPHPRRRS